MPSALDHCLLAVPETIGEIKPKALDHKHLKAKLRCFYIVSGQEVEKNAEANIASCMGINTNSRPETERACFKVWGAQPKTARRLKWRSLGTWRYVIFKGRLCFLHGLAIVDDGNFDRPERG
jgi:hypothetical protein